MLKVEEVKYNSNANSASNLFINDYNIDKIT
jgi:hypothetical protein